MPSDSPSDNGAVRLQPARNDRSSTAHSIHIGEERRKGDRRLESVGPWRRLVGGPLRRARGRRITDRSHYVDVYTRKDVALILAIFLLNVGDAFLTMMWLSRGGREANPVMDFFLDIGPGAFIVQKCFIVGLWLVVLMIHKNFRFARVGLYAALVVYSLLMLVHFGIIAFGVKPQLQPSEAEASGAAEAEARELRRVILMQNAPERLDFSLILEED
jgi:hypothetical protein